MWMSFCTLKAWIRDIVIMRNSGNRNAIKSTIALTKMMKSTEAEAPHQPTFIPLLDLFDSTSVDALAIDQWWQKGSPWGFLRAPIGKIGQGKNFILDLNACESGHGPHGIIGGVAGSGKSMLLKSIILSYAITHSPKDINFVLIDHIGGATFKELQWLPHVADVPLEIASQESYARQVMKAIEREIQRRRQILLDAKEKHGIEGNINQYHDLKEKPILPRLVIIIDEYAAFKDQIQDENRSLIKLAQQGRSLGIHLLLCTQEPVGTMDQDLRQHCRFQMSLRAKGAREPWQLPIGSASFQIVDNIEFQSVYPEAPYFPVGHFTRTSTNGQKETIFSVNLSQTKQNQSQVIVEKIKRTAFELQDHLTPGG
jgi:DNA segregation ATPase FtsK/SpoIIIE, S-DNA-T family